ncbi:MAG: hypothetical protein KatS3mg076_0119 [Candidatus Binatia bacterium]|nr:MAG: hypothetical protein KatS3mg076_0119 [Candidatus Binatia bacterium]
MCDPRFARGVAEFHAGHFFEAHEIWEDLWLETQGPEKLLYQGLIQIAAGYHKFSLGSLSGAKKLLSRGLEKVRKFLGNPDLPLEAFSSGVAEDLARLESEGEAASLRPPRFPELPASQRN